MIFQKLSNSRHDRFNGDDVKPRVRVESGRQVINIVLLQERVISRRSHVTVRVNKVPVLPGGHRVEQRRSLKWKLQHDQVNMIRPFFKSIDTVQKGASVSDSQPTVRIVMSDQIG